MNLTSTTRKICAGIMLGSLCILSFTQATPQSQNTLALQKCNNAPEIFNAIGGSAIGMGSTPQEAKHDAAKNALAVILLTPLQCDICPNGLECNSSQNYQWDNAKTTPPVWEPGLQLYWVKKTWDGCKITQWCFVCE